MASNNRTLGNKLEEASKIDENEKAKNEKIYIECIEVVRIRKHE